MERPHDLVEKGGHIRSLSAWDPMQSVQMVHQQLQNRGPVKFNDTFWQPRFLSQSSPPLFPSFTRDVIPCDPIGSKALVPIFRVVIYASDICAQADRLQN
ncbi:hypothetical protein PspLS_05032 [Pyricularia sp. CBS 133598]|nr:hypothetical protein PspLS_05032 [Pyricularia sp. CBS 133598]